MVTFSLSSISIVAILLLQIEETLEKADLQLHTELWYTESGTATNEVNGVGASSDRDSAEKNENGESPPQNQHNPS